MSCAILGKGLLLWHPLLFIMFSFKGVLRKTKNLCKGHAKTSQLKIKLSLPIFYSQIIGRKIKICDYYS